MTQLPPHAGVAGFMIRVVLIVLHRAFSAVLIPRIWCGAMIFAFGCIAGVSSNFFGCHRPRLSQFGATCVLRLRCFSPGNRKAVPEDGFWVIGRFGLAVSAAVASAASAAMTSAATNTPPAT